MVRFEISTHRSVAVLENLQEQQGQSGPAGGKSRQIESRARESIAENRSSDGQRWILYLHASGPGRHCIEDGNALDSLRVWSILCLGGKHWIGEGEDEGADRRWHSNVQYLLHRRDSIHFLRSDGTHHATHCSCSSVFGHEYERLQRWICRRYKTVEPVDWLHLRQELHRWLERLGWSLEMPKWLPVSIIWCVRLSFLS